MKVIMLLKGDINYDARVQKFIRSLARRGFEITLIVWNWNPINFKYKNLGIIELNMSGYKMPTNPFVAYFLSIIYYILASRIINSMDYDFLHFNDLNTFVTSLFIRKKSGRKIIYDAHELLPEAEHSSFRRSVWNVLERLVIGKADVIVVPEKNRAEYMKKKYKLKRLPLIINNFPELSEIKKSCANNMVERLNLTGKKIIVYQGKIEEERFIEEMILSLTHLPEDYIFVLIGGMLVTYEEHIHKMADEHKVSDRLIFYGKVEPKNMLNTLYPADVGLAFYGDSTLNSYYCAPNKIFDYIMAGLGVVTNQSPALDMLEGLESVVRINKIEPFEIAEAILQVSDKKGRIGNDTARAFSWNSLEQRIDALYRKYQDI